MNKITGFVPLEDYRLEVRQRAVPASAEITN